MGKHLKMLCLDLLVFKLIHKKTHWCSRKGRIFACATLKYYFFWAWTIIFTVPQKWNLNVNTVIYMYGIRNYITFYNFVSI